MKLKRTEKYRRKAVSWLREFWNQVLYGENGPKKTEISERKSHSAPEKVPEPFSSFHATKSSEPLQPHSPAGKTPAKPAFIKPTKKKPVYVQVGLDFGTSGTKVAYRRLDDSRVRALDFEHDLEHFPSFVLPSVAEVFPGKGLVFGVEAANILVNHGLEKGLRNLKVILAGKHDMGHRDEGSAALFEKNLGPLRARLGNLAEEYICSLFLAHVISESKRQIMRQPALENSDPDFAWNVCLPIDHIENSDLWKVFQKVLACSELCVSEWEVLAKSSFEFGKWKLLWDKAEYGPSPKISYERQNPSARVFAIPESVAQVASYLESQAKESGLHALIDFGAGTTDVSIFNLSLNEKCYWYAAANVPRGGRALELRLAKILGNGKEATEVDMRSIQLVLSDLSRSKNRRAPHLSCPKAQKALEEHLSEVYTMAGPTWGRATQKLKEQFKWKEVRVFKGGGASGFPEVDENFSIPYSYGLGKKGVRYPVERVPLPDNYVSSHFAPFDRISVAYGLTIPGPSLADYILPKDTPDQTSREIPVDFKGVFDGGFRPIPGRGWV
jgi:hypothetical protein